MFTPKDARELALNESVTFRCQLCGDCCRNVKDSVMLEPMDAYNLARFLREQGDPVAGTEDVLARYTHAVWLSDRFPMFVLNTEGALDACTLLNAGRCTVYEARPRTCRLYPFSVGPGSRGRDFRYYLCTEKPHHFADGTVVAKDWLSQNFNKEAKAVFKAEYGTLPILGSNLRALTDEQFKRLLFSFLFYRYYNYDLDKPFLPQFFANLEDLKKITAGESPP